MNLEALPKYYSPKSPKLSDDAPATGSGGLTITDVMAAQGMVQSKAPLGFALFLAKVGVQDPQFAIEGLLNYAMALDNPTLNKLSEETRLQIIPYLVNFAFADYSRSAASKARCEHCAGTGFHNVLREVVKHSRSGESVIKEEWVTEGVFMLPKLKTDDMKTGKKVYLKSGKVQLTNSGSDPLVGVVWADAGTSAEEVPVKLNV